MKLCKLKMRLIAPLVVVCCLIAVGSQPAQAQTCTTVIGGSGISAANGNTVLMLATTLTDFHGSPTGDLCTSLEAAQAMAIPLHLNVEIDDAVAWGAKSTAQFTSYRAIVLGDPNCPPSGGTVPITEAQNTTGTWGPAITGPIAVVGTDPEFHFINGSGLQAAQLTQNAIAHATSASGHPGAYISLSCYYFNSAPNTPVPVLAPFGSFTVEGQITGSTNNSHIVAPTNSLATTPNILTDAGLSNWRESTHEAFNSFPSNFTTVVQSVDLNLPYILSRESVTLQFNPSGTQTQIATIGSPNDPAAQSLALTLASVTNAINVSVTFFYEPTDVSTGTHGVGIADGDCEVLATEDTDFDCRLAANFTYPPGPVLPSGDRLVPHIIPSHNNLGVWVRVTATRVSDGQPAVAGIDYTGPVDWYYAWNSNPSLANPTPNPVYIPGWNNQNPQMYDRPGENLDIAFVKNITAFSKFNCNPTCVGTADPGVGGITGKLNDIVVGAPPNPPTGIAADAVELLVPAPGISPFPYASGVPMLVAFKLENESQEKSDPTALTLPHSVNVATFLNGVNIPVQYPTGFPTTFTYNSFFKAYFIFLSPALYKTDGTVYTLQIDSDLFPQPITATFVVKKFQF